MRSTYSYRGALYICSNTLNRSRVSPSSTSSARRREKLSPLFLGAGGGFRMFLSIVHPTGVRGLFRPISDTGVRGELEHVAKLKCSCTCVESACADREGAGISCVVYMVAV